MLIYNITIVDDINLISNSLTISINMINMIVIYKYRGNPLYSCSRFQFLWVLTAKIIGTRSEIGTRSGVFRRELKGLFTNFQTWALGTRSNRNQSDRNQNREQLYEPVASLLPIRASCFAPANPPPKYEPVASLLPQATRFAPANPPPKYELVPSLLPIQASRFAPANCPSKTSGTNSISGTNYFVPLFSGTKCQNQKSLFGHPSSIRYCPQILKR